MCALSSLESMFDSTDKRQACGFVHFYKRFRF